MNFKEFDNPREKQQVRPVTTMTPKELGDRIEKAKAKAFKKPEQPDISKLWAKEKPATEEKVDYANLMFRGKEIDHNSIEYEMQDFSDMIYELHGAKYIDGTELDDDELEELEKTGEMLDWISADYASSGPDAPDDYPVGEVAPPGREKQVKALKGKVDNPYAVAWASYNKSKGKKESEVQEDAMTSADVDRIRNQQFTDRQIKHAFRVLNHPSVKGGNYTAAYNIINRIAPGLADHPSVANALRRANEMQEMRGSTLAVRTISNYADELGPDSMDYEMFKKSAEMLEKGELEELGKFLYNSDTSPREYVMKVISKKDPDTFKQMYGDQEGYMSLMKPNRTEGFIGKKPEYTDFLQNKLDQAIQEYDTPEKKAERDALMQKYLKKGGKVEKVPAGKTAYKNKELKPAYRKDNGTPITSPGSDESVEEDISEKGRIVLEKAGFDPNAIHEYMAVFNAHGDTTDLDDMNQNKIGVADAMAMVLASHDVENESAIKEDGPPFGSGMDLVRRALMNKWITADEWFHLKDEWHNAADEIEQRYSDWPEGQGFGSSDHNFAIKELMGLAGYEFDEHDTSGSFIVTKMPEKLEKKGIKNVRMRGEPAKAEAELDERMPASVIQHKEKLAHMSDKELADRFKDYDETELRKMAWRHGYGKMGSHYIDRVRNHMTSKRTGTTEEVGPGFAVRYSLNGERKVQAYKTEKDAKHRAEILRSMGGVKDVSITTHTLNFKKEATYESKLVRMLNQRLK